MGNSAGHLMALIREYLAKRIGYDHFSRSFSESLVGDTANPELSEAEEVFFGDILERIDYTAAVVAPEDRRYRWQTEEEFRAWLLGFVEGQTGPVTGASDSGTTR